MASKRMLPHTITLFNFVDEIDFKPVYEITILKNVMCNIRQGIAPSTRDRNPNDSADLYIFDKNVEATDINGNPKVFMPLEQWNNCEDKGSYWTISTEGRDMFAKGIYLDKVDPTEISEATEINSALHLDAGSTRMWHWEINGN